MKTVEPQHICFALAALFAISFLAGLLWLDPVLVGMTDPSRSSAIALTYIVVITDHATTKFISDIHVPLIMLFAGVYWRRRGDSVPTQSGIGQRLVYWGGAWMIAVVIGDVLKPVFGRLRPIQFLERGLPLANEWLAGGSGFPSGHAAFYAGLCFPLMILLPRWTLLWIAIPLTVAAQRMLSASHFLSDVSFSMMVAALVAGLLSRYAVDVRRPEVPE